MAITNYRRSSFIATILTIMMVLPLMVPPGNAARSIHQGLSYGRFLHGGITKVSLKKEPADDDCNCDNPTDDCACHCCQCCGDFVLPPHDGHLHHQP
ncbi:conserved hypothetical protein [Ricinus communis]|uniref:Uncharacterized protein n=1 Tax=Ricinus communis TaxID=3988 RepID=B9RQA5_RICCO|nr:conserved hypothetical protein [Ricinus communis]